MNKDSLMIWGYWKFLMNKQQLSILVKLEIEPMIIKLAYFILQTMSNSQNHQYGEVKLECINN